MDRRPPSLLSEFTFKEIAAEYQRRAIGEKMGLNKTETIDCAMRVLWALVERAGGTITVSDQEAGPVTGAVKVSRENGSITVSVGAGASATQQ